MSFLDLYQGDQDQAAKIQPNEGSRLPSTFKENFDAAWSDGQLFSQSIAKLNARGAALDDYADEVKRKTGADLSQDLGPKEGGAPLDYDAVNSKIAALKAKDPSLDIAPLSDDEIDQRALAKSQAAHRTYETLQSGERTAGGAVGSFMGSAASSAADPINIVGMGIAPEAAGIGILATALRWGALAGVSQAAIEFSSDQFKEQVQPGYMESGAPLQEIAGAAIGGAVLGGTTKALGAAWTRVKTGQWPTSVRDAGNVIESEAHTASTNPFPGAEGEVAHREALSKATDDILSNRPVDVSAMITPDLLERSRGLIEKLQTEQPMALPVINRRAIELAADHERLSARDAELASNIEKMPEGDASAADRLNRLQAVEQQITETTDPAAKKALNERKDQILVDTNPEALQAAAAPIEARRQAEAERASIAGQLQDISEEHARMQASTSLLGPSQLPALGQRQRIPTGPKGQFEMDLGPPAPEKIKAAAVKYNGDVTEGIIHADAMDELAQKYGNKVWDDKSIDHGFTTTNGRFVGREEAFEIANRNDQMTKSGAEGLPKLHADNLSDVHNKVAADIFKDMPPLPIGPQPALQTPEQMAKVLTEPAHQDAIRADIDRARAMGDVQVPGIDENGNHTMIGVDKAMNEVDAYKAVAEQIQACANPVQEAAE